MTIDPKRAQTVFLAALEMTDSARRQLLDRECGSDLALRQRVEELLAAHEATGLFAESLGPSDSVGLDASAAGFPGSVVAGRYKLLEKIGEGGMGDVWVADQLAPIRRRVAIKLIKPGMDSRGVLARFEAERQALALMDHPNIARVLDAGTTDDHRPYFVMELVKGTPITEFCDARKFSPRERLELFIPVCQAIQHAHTKGIIHRDIKPSNVLVALHDERPVAKVIDFGVSKAIGQQLTEKTLYTGFGALVGTPTYMAPEQATFNQLDIDTRADVYSLGVLLYELLAGSPPVEPERVRKAALDEMLRLVREEEPPRPSQRLSTSQARASIAAVRQSDPEKLSKLIRGELDWIVMKALEKDRNRRYETANGFAADVQRYLSGEQVLAVPPSAMYQVRKFARKNRTVLFTAFAFMGLLLTAATLSGWLAVKAWQAEAVARKQQFEAEENEQLADSFAMDAAARATQLEIELQRSEVKSASRQVDVDLLALPSSIPSGLLRLCRTSGVVDRSLGKPKVSSRVEFKGKSIELNNFFEVEVRQLREFVTAVVLAKGQEFALLLPPITHDGAVISRHSVSKDNERILTLGDDGKTRLWDTRTGKLISILRRDNEHIVNCGFSADGQTVFTDDRVSVARCWKSLDGSFLSQIAERPNRYPSVEHGFPADTLQLSGNRLLTKGSVASQVDDGAGGQQTVLGSVGPVELWDTMSGRLIGRLDRPGHDAGTFALSNSGRRMTSISDNKTAITIFNAEDGAEVVTLDHPRPFQIMCDSPSERYLNTRWIDEAGGEHFQVWDTVEGRSLTQLEPWWRHAFFLSAHFLTDKLFEVNGDAAWCVYTVDNTEPVTSVSELGQFDQFNRTNNFEIIRATDEHILMGDGNLVAVETGKRLRPPAGRKYPPELTAFASDGRFVEITSERESLLLDSITEKLIRLDYSMRPIRGFGLASVFAGPDSVGIRLLPSADRLDIPVSAVELWAQVALRGELDDQGEFVEWNETEWEKKRQELAAIPPPIKDFPFPGHVANDKLHWLRAEYHETTDDSEKKRLAQKLIRLAESNGEAAEAARWRTVLEVNAE